jgi:hypothetical protein
MQGNCGVVIFPEFFPGSCDVKNEAAIPMGRRVGRQGWHEYCYFSLCKF